MSHGTTTDYFEIAQRLKAAALEIKGEVDCERPSEWPVDRLDQIILDAQALKAATIQPKKIAGLSEHGATDQTIELARRLSDSAVLRDKMQLVLDQFKAGDVYVGERGDKRAFAAAAIANIMRGE
tara:strand:- start:2676 stop:3050 length:375 start_codon:yes stop_codon:yes gene_type:complete